VGPDQSSYTSDLRRIVGQTRESLDIIVNPFVTALSYPSRDSLGADIAGGVRKRAIMPTVASPRLRSDRDREIHEHFGWDVRVLFMPPIDGFVLSDCRTALRVHLFHGSHSSMLSHEVDTEPKSVDLTQHNFNNLWHETEPLELLYKADTSLWLPSSAATIAIAASDFHDRLLKDVRLNPELVHSLDPYEFEKLTAELLRRQGIAVHVTPRSKDGGFDILAQHTTPLGKLLYLVECKRWAPDNPVGVEIVNALYGVVERRNATGGMIVTTSRFTSGALEAARTLESRMTLTDYRELQNWLKN
jgi:hypothetical protein